MNIQTLNRINALLSLDSPDNYDCWEDAEESILQDLTDGEAEEYINSGDPVIQEWFTYESK